LTKDGLVLHAGKVIRFEAGKVSVRIISKSACAKCHAKGVCTASDMSEKIIDAVCDEEMKEGDSVNIVMEEKLGWIAIFYSFFLPFLVLFTVLLIVQSYTGSDIAGGLAGLGSLFPYYVVLYLFRKKIEKKFIFRAEKK